MEWRNRTGHGLAGGEYRLAMKVAVAVAVDVVAVAAAAETVETAAAGSVAGTEFAEMTAEWIVGKSTEARFETWYEDSERP